MDITAVGATVPDFELPDQDGTRRRLSDLLAAGPLVLFCFPSASVLSVGCTIEACSFRNHADDFAAGGATRAGLSMDPVPKLKRFAESSRLDYPLLSDESGEVIDALGVRGHFPSAVRRVTFVIGVDRTVLKVISGRLSMSVHAAESLDYLTANPG